MFLTIELICIFPKHKLAAKTDEKGHTDRDEKRKKKREKRIKEKNL